MFLDLDSCRRVSVVVPLLLTTASDKDLVTHPYHQLEHRLGQHLGASVNCLRLRNKAFLLPTVLTEGDPVGRIVWTVVGRKLFLSCHAECITCVQFVGCHDTEFMRSVRSATALANGHVKYDLLLSEDDSDLLQRVWGSTCTLRET